MRIEKGKKGNNAFYVGDRKKRGESEQNRCSKHKTRKLRLKVKARSSKERSLFIYSTDMGPGDYDRKIDRGTVVAILLCTWRLIGID